MLSKGNWEVWLLAGLSGAAAITAALGPVLGLEAKAVQFEKAAMGHCIVRERILRLLNDLKISDLDESHEARDREVDAFRTALSALDEPAHERVKARARQGTLLEEGA